MSNNNTLMEFLLRTRADSSGAKQTTDDLNKVGEAAKKAGGFAQFLGDNFSITAGDLVNFAKQLPAIVGELVDLGVSADRARTALTSYAGGGKEATEMITAMQDATNGALSEMATMQSATKLLSMGLADNAEEAAKLTDIAVTLGSTMGKGPQEAFEEFTLLLANQSILRLDTFGISGATVRQRMEDMAKATGETDRQLLFLNATMEEAGKKMATLDEAGYEATNSIDRMKAMTEDAKLATGTWLADGLLPIADGLLGMKDALETNRDSAQDLSGSYEDYRKALEGNKNVVQWYYAYLTKMSEEEWEQAQAVKATAVQYALWNEEQSEAARIQEKLAVVVTEATTTTTLQGDELERTFRLMAGMPIEDSMLSLGTYKASMIEAATATRDLGNAHQEAAEKAKFQGDALNGLALAADEARLAELLMKVATGEATWEHLSQELRLRELQTAYKAGSLSIYDYIAATVDGTVTQGEFFKLMGYSTAEIDKYAGELFIAQQNALGLTDAINGIPGSKTVDIMINQTTTVNHPTQWTPPIAFQHGGQFVVDGPPGVDRVPVQFWATRGEAVTVTPVGGGGGSGGGGGDVYQITYAPSFSTASIEELGERLIPLIESARRNR